MYQTVIVEDNRMIADLHREYLHKCGDFEVSAILTDGEAAWRYFSENQGPADLAILDIYMPGLTGLELLNRMRSAHIMLPVIMVTAANDLEAIQSSLNAGVIDYLIKPFSFDRFAQAMGNFRMRAELLSSIQNEHLEQSSLDQLLSTYPQSAIEKEPLEKGLNQKTLDRIYEWLKLHPYTRISCEELSRNLQLSKVTIRRYLNYLIKTNDIESTVDYHTGGRPSVLYRLKG